MIELDPWGRETARSEREWEQVQPITTYERDGNGVDQAQMRSYRGWWSRFDQPDPWDGSYDLAEPQTFNRYAYVRNDPVNYVDPSGLLLVPHRYGSCSIVGYVNDQPIIVCFTDNWNTPAPTTGWEEFPGGGGGGGGASGQGGQQANSCINAALAVVPRALRTSAAQLAVSLLLSKASEAGLTRAQAAYVLATAQHESRMGNTMYEPRWYAASQPYGVKWRGRGYVHLTWRSNYEAWSVNGDLVNDPDLAANPEIAAEIAVYGMQAGAFRQGHSLERYIPRDGDPDFYNARWIINRPNRRERRVARNLVRYANSYLKALEECGWGNG